MITTIALAVTTLGMVFALIALAAEVRKSLTLGAQVVRFRDLFIRLENETRLENARHAHQMAALDEVLVTVELQRDIREPAHEILEYLVLYGPSTMAELIDQFGPHVGRQLAELTTESGYLNHDENHHLWWVGLDRITLMASPQPQTASRSDSEASEATEMATSGLTTSPEVPTGLRLTDWAQS